VEAAKRFFVDVLGLEIERDHPTFVQFKAGDGASYAIASDQPMDPASGGKPELWWVVEDAEAAFREMSASAKVSMPLTQMPLGRASASRTRPARSTMFWSSPRAAEQPLA